MVIILKISDGLCHLTRIKGSGKTAIMCAIIHPRCIQCVRPNLAGGCGLINQRYN